MKWITVFLASALVRVMSPDFAFASNDQVDASEWRMQLNVAGRQRMLTQQMTKAACMKILHINPVKRSEEAFIAAAEFEDNLDDLINGDTRRNLAPVQDPKSQAILREVVGTSPALTSSIKQLVSGDLHSFAMALVLERNVPLLEKAEETVSLIEAAAREGHTGPMVASTLNKAGRQRMLSQRIAKNLCLISANLEAEKARKDLVVASANFTQTMAGLRHGDPANGLLPPPTSDIEARLETVQGCWQRVQDSVMTVQTGGSVTPARLQEIVAELDLILEEMDAVLQLWVAHE